MNISHEEINTGRMHTRKSLLFNNTNLWIKKNGDPEFEVAMGSFNNAKLCELDSKFWLKSIENIDLIPLFWKYKRPSS